MGCPYLLGITNDEERNVSIQRARLSFNQKQKKSFSSKEKNEKNCRPLFTIRFKCDAFM